MAQIDQVRDFTGNPYPSPRAPEAPKVAAAPAPAGASEPAAAAGGAPGPAEEGKPGPKPKAEISAVESGDGFDLFMATDDDPAVPMGRALIDRADAEKVLRAAPGAWYNAEAKSYEGLSEPTVKALKAGRLGLTENIIANYKQGEAQLTRSGLGLSMLRGEFSREDAVARGHVELLKVQLGEQPQFAWKGLGNFAAEALEAAKHPVETFRFVSGVTAKQAPNFAAGIMAAVEGAVKGGAAGAASLGAAVAATGPAGLPSTAVAIQVGARAGAAYSTWKHYVDVETGATALEMAEKVGPNGAVFNDETIKDLAPLAGVLKGTLEAASFGVMTAPLKRGFIKTVLASTPVKAAMSKWYVTYAKSVGAEVSTELAQTRIDQAVNNMAAQIEEKPELLLKPAEAKDQLIGTFVESLAVAAVMGGAGAGIDATLSHMDAKGKAKADAAAAEAEAERAKKIEAAVAPVDPAAAEPAGAAIPPAAPVDGNKVIDSSGDYLPRAEAATLKIDDASAKLEKGEVSPVTAAEQIETAVTEMDDRPANYGEKIIDVERKALIETRKRELAANIAEIKALEAERARYVRNKMSTETIKNRIDKRLEENASLRGDIEFYEKTPASRVGIDPNDVLSMKPATLENVIELGFKEGRKEVLGTRRKAVLDVAKRLELTQADLRTILKDKNYGTMGDVEFKNWLDDKFKVEAQALAERRVMQKKVRRAQIDKGLQKEHLLRQQAELPAVKDMTVEQMQTYIDLLSTFERGDRMLTPRRKKALETTPLAGSRSWGEVLKRSRELWDLPLDDAAKLLPEKAIIPDTMRGMERLIARSPAHKALIAALRTELISEEAIRQAKHEKLMELGAKALASRKSLAGRVMDPTMPQVRAYLEADDDSVYTGEQTLPDLTPAEMELVEFIEQIYAEGLDYLQSVEGLKTRFDGKYFTHTKRPFMEVIKDIKDVGWRATLKELYESATPTIINFDEAKGGVGLRKHIKQMQFRTGNMKPSQNVLMSVSGYLQAIHRKRALDRAVPLIDTTVDAITWSDQDRSVEGKARAVEFKEFFNDYLKSTKGQAIIKQVPHGSFIDLVARTLTSMPAWAWIAANPKLQVAAKVGEVMTSVMAAGPMGLLNAWRMRVLAGLPEKVRGEFGTAVANYLKANEGFTGEPILDLDAFLHGEFRGRWRDPSLNLNERAGMLLFGMLQQHRVDTMRDVLLALSTKEEIMAGKISPKRLQEIEALASRWIDVKGAKSVLGATSVGMIATQFKGWAVPIIGTALEDHGALLKQIKGQGKMTELQKLELQRLYAVWATTALVAVWAGDRVDDKEDKRLTTQFLRAIYRELFSLSSGANPLMFFAVPAASYLFRLGQALGETAVGLFDWAIDREENRGAYKTGENEGKLKGPRALARLAPGAAGVRTAKEMIYGEEE
jgi:hypothetical protein